MNSRAEWRRQCLICGQRVSILISQLAQLSGFRPAVDCLSPGCSGERTFAVSERASFYGRNITVGKVLRRMRCLGGCGGRVAAAWLARC